MTTELTRFRDALNQSKAKTQGSMMGYSAADIDAALAAALAAPPAFGTDTSPMPAPAPAAAPPASHMPTPLMCGTCGKRPVERLVQGGSFLCAACALPAAAPPVARELTDAEKLAELRDNPQIGDAWVYAKQPRKIISVSPLRINGMMNDGYFNSLQQYVDAVGDSLSAIQLTPRVPAVPAPTPAADSPPVPSDVTKPPRELATAPAGGAAGVLAGAAGKVKRIYEAEYAWLLQTEDMCDDEPTWWRLKNSDNWGKCGRRASVVAASLWYYNGPAFDAIAAAFYAWRDAKHPLPPAGEPELARVTRQRDEAVKDCHKSKEQLRLLRGVEENLKQVMAERDAANEHRKELSRRLTDAEKQVIEVQQLLVKVENDADLSACLRWDKPMTSGQAASYLLTCGFVAAELYGATKRERDEARAKLADAIESANNRDKKWMDGINEVVGEKLNYDFPDGTASRGLDQFVSALRADRDELREQLSSAIADRDRLAARVAQLEGCLRGLMRTATIGYDRPLLMQIDAILGDARREPPPPDAAESEVAEGQGGK